MSLKKNILHKNNNKKLFINHNVLSELILLCRKNIAMGSKCIFGIYQTTPEGHLLRIRWELKGNKYEGNKCNSLT